MRSSRTAPVLPSFEAKVRSPRWLVQARRRFQRQGTHVVFTNGCFDLLHVGHAVLLERAKRLGDILIVGINSDRSIRGLKGPERPIVPQADRARLLAALASVDYVTIFDAPTPLQLITQLKPDVLVKGADWRTAGVVGQEVVQRAGGKVVLLPLVRGRSTTKLVGRLNTLAPRAGRRAASRAAATD